MTSDGLFFDLRIFHDSDLVAIIQAHGGDAREEAYYMRRNDLCNGQGKMSKSKRLLSNSNRVVCLAVTDGTGCLNLFQFLSFTQHQQKQSR